MKPAITVIKEQIANFYLMRRLSVYELKSKNKNNYLGMAWEVLNPVIQILIYWFVFGTIIQRPAIDIGQGIEVPFIARSEEHTSELQSRGHLVCRLLLEKKKNKIWLSSS